MKIKIEFDITKDTLKSPISFIKRVVLTDTRRTLKVMSLIFAFLLLKYYFDTEVSYIVIAIYFMVSVLFSIESKFSFGIALFFLASVPIFLSLGYEGSAENYAVFAYFFLTIGTALALIEYIRDSRNPQKEKNNVNSSKKQDSQAPSSR